MALNNLHLEPDSTGNMAFIDTDSGREISNMYFADLISFEEKLDDIIDNVKILIKTGVLAKGIKKEIKRVLGLVI